MDNKGLFAELNTRYRHLRDGAYIEFPRISYLDTLHGHVALSF